METLHGIGEFQRTNNSESLDITKVVAASWSCIEWCCSCRCLIWFKKVNQLLDSGMLCGIGPHFKFSLNTYHLAHINSGSDWSSALKARFPALFPKRLLALTSCKFYCLLLFMTRDNVLLCEFCHYYPASNFNMGCFYLYPNDYLCASYLL